MRLVSLAVALATFAAGCVVPTDPEPAAETLTTLAAPVVALVTQVDAERWSGEPSILAMKDGTLLITGVGGFTRYAEDPTDIPGKAGQSYLWRSTDGGKSWQFIDLGLPQPLGGILPYRNAILGIEGDLAEDEAGRAYFIDLTMLAVNGLSVSEDSGATWTSMQTPIVGLPATDRPWVAAFGDGIVYVKYLQLGLGVRMARSEDGGRTFLDDVPLDGCGNADFIADAGAREVLVPCVGGGKVFLLRTAEGPMNWERIDVADVGGDAGAAAADFPSVGVASTGEYLVAWREGADEGTRIRLAASTDRGATWSKPVTPDDTPFTRVFPWVSANEAGDVGLVWYGADAPGDPNEIDAQWFPYFARYTLADDGTLTFGGLTQLSTERVHKGSICTSGLMCVIEGRANDRRLLDFFEIDLDDEGRAHVSWTTTQTDVPTVWYGQVAP